MYQVSANRYGSVSRQVRSLEVPKPPWYALTTSLIGIPNFEVRSPVDILGWVFGETSGLTRNAISTFLSRLSAISDNEWSSSENQLKPLTPICAAFWSSKSVFEFRHWKDFLTRDSGKKRHIKLTVTENIGSCSLSCKNPEYGKASICLSGIIYIGIPECFPVSQKIFNDTRFIGDVQGSSEPFRKIFGISPADYQMIVTDLKMIFYCEHGRTISWEHIIVFTFHQK